MILALGNDVLELAEHYLISERANLNASPSMWSIAEGQSLRTG